MYIRYLKGLYLKIQRSANTPIAVKYHGASILENQSIDKSLEMLRKNSFLDALNFGELIPDVKQKFETLFRGIILMTDMAFHFPLAEKLNAILLKRGLSFKESEGYSFAEERSSDPDLLAPQPSFCEFDEEERTIMIQILVHAAGS